MIASNRLAKNKLEMYEALAAYANIGDTPEDWKRFRHMYPDFFPSTSGFRWAGFESLSSWMYASAEDWYKLLSNQPKFHHLLPPLLWYRNRLRAVWARNDQHGYNLAVLLGFEREAKEIAIKHPGETVYDGLYRPLIIPGQSTNPSKQESEGLPQGKPVINGVRGELRWEFACNIQTAVYELMQERWRAKGCLECGRFFVALKTAQKLCSVRCSDETKRKRALAWWNEKGKKRRG